MPESDHATFDPCPWHRDTKPSASVQLVGHRDEPIVDVRVYCPKCGASRHYHPTEREVQESYESRYSDNRRLIAAIRPKLLTLWNWQQSEAAYQAGYERAIKMVAEGE